MKRDRDDQIANLASRNKMTKTGQKNGTKKHQWDSQSPTVNHWISRDLQMEI